MAVVLVVNLQPLEGQSDALVEAFSAAVPDVHAEPGCEYYALHRGDDGLVLIEKWSTGEQLAAHSTGEAVKAIGAAFEGKLAAPPDIRRLTPIPAGGPQGAI
jgi:quinol monooxygenase YgiN